MSVEIREVTNSADFKRFVRFPFSLYRNSEQWVPPLVRNDIRALQSDCNPAFEHCTSKYWLAVKDGTAAGRIAGIINSRVNEKWHTNDARFGWIEFVDDPEVSSSLIGAVEKWAAEHKMSRVLGPMGFTGLDAEGMLVEGFEECGTMTEIYNHPYYRTHIESLGYRKEKDWVEYELKTPTSIPEKAVRVGQLVLKRSGLHIADAARASDLLRYADQVFALLNEAYKPLYGSVELTPEQINEYKKRFFGFVDPRFNKVIVDRHDNVVAFGLVFPNLAGALKRARGHLFPFGWVHVSRAVKHPNKLVLGLIAVSPDRQAGGVPAILFSEITRAAIDCGITSAETGRELEDNVQVRSLWKSYDARQHKRRRVYVRDL